jgi:thymidylate kinase
MVRNAFLDLSKRYADRYVKIDASKTFEEVIEDAYQEIKKRL